MPWKDGESGNPGGRPKKKLFADALRMQLLQPASLDDGGQPNMPKISKKARHLDMVANSLIRSAYVGLNRVQAIKEIRDTLDGKPPQALEHSGMIAATHEELLKQLDCQHIEDDDADREEDTPPAEG